MTEFEKFWERQGSGDKSFAEKVWQVAQLAVIRTIANPPIIPKEGDFIKFLSLCNPMSLKNIAEVLKVYNSSLSVYWLEAKRIRNGEEIYTSGIIGEIEIIKRHF